MGRRYLPVGGLQREYDEATGSFLRVVDSQKETFSATPDLEQGLVVMASSFGAIGDGQAPRLVAPPLPWRNGD